MKGMGGGAEQSYTPHTRIHYTGYRLSTSKDNQVKMKILNINWIRLGKIKKMLCEREVHLKTRGHAQYMLNKYRYMFGMNMFGELLI